MCNNEIYSNFNPRSRGGSDGLNRLETIRTTNFNPRSRGGSDITVDGSFGPATISIHAPAEGAKCCGFSPGGDMIQNFNPRSRGGSDRAARSAVADYLRFQSTLPRRERPSIFMSVWIPALFQSTLPRRERHQQDIQ